METGIIKRWNAERGWGLIYAPGGRRFFLHVSKIISGTPELFRRVTFDVGERRNPQELPPGINVAVRELVSDDARSTTVRP